MSWRNGVHYQGPILTSSKACAGAFEDLDLGDVNKMRSPYRTYFSDLSSIGSITQAEACGWIETAVGTAASRSVAYNAAQGCLVINADTVADEGSNLQFNGTPTTGGRDSNLLPAVTSTTTLMDTRELIWATRISALVGNGSTYDSKMVLGWFVTDTALMTAATGALAVGTGGGIGFHISGDAGGTATGSIDCVVGQTLVSTASGVSITTAGSTFATVGWIDLAFRARWVDASAGTGNVDFFVNGVKVVSVNGADTGLPMQSTQAYCNSVEVINGAATADQVDVGIEYIFNAISRPGMTYPYSSGFNF